MRSIAKIMIIFTALLLAAPADAQPRPGGGTKKPGGEGGSAQGGLITFVQLEQLARIFSAAGIKSSVEKLQNGVQIVKMEIWPDTYSAALPSNCKDDGTQCGGYQIFVNLGDTGVNDAWLQAWNSRYLFVRTYKLDNGAQIFRWDGLTRGGVTPDNIALSAVIFKNIVEQATDFKP